MITLTDYEHIKKYIGFTFDLSDKRQMDRSSTRHRLPIFWDSDSDTEDSSVGKQTEETRSGQEQTVGGPSYWNGNFIYKCVFKQVFGIVKHVFYKSGT